MMSNYRNQGGLADASANPDRPNWIKGAIKHPGALHRKLGVPVGKKIPAVKLKAAQASKSPTLRKEANLAKTLSHFHK
jgi:hypothetical protein